MPGQNHQLGAQLWMIEGGFVADVWGLPEAANVLLYLIDSRLYLLDSGMGEEMRAAIEQQLMAIGAVKSFTLLNTGTKPACNGNNDLIHNVLADEKQHWRPDEEASGSDARKAFARHLYEISRYFDPLHPLEGKRLRQFGLRLVRAVLAAFSDQQHALQWMVSFMARRWPLLHPSLETAATLPEETLEALEIGGAAWQGWRLGQEGEDDVWVLKAGKGWWCYLPKENAFFAPHWQDGFLLADPKDDEQTQAVLLERLQTMLRSGEAQLLVGSAHSEGLQDSDQALAMIEELLNRREGLQQALEAVLRREPGMTIRRLNRRLHKLRHRPAVAWYLDAPLPMEMVGFEEFLTGLLLEMGCTTKGIWRRKRFYIP